MSRLLFNEKEYADFMKGMDAVRNDPNAKDKVSTIFTNSLVAIAKASHRRFSELEARIKELEQK